MRYFFHIHDAKGMMPDDEGSELPDLAAAEMEARLSARDLAIEDLKRGAAIKSRWIEIVDSHGTVLGTAKISDVMN